MTADKHIWLKTNSYYNANKPVFSLFPLNYLSQQFWFFNAKMFILIVFFFFFFFFFDFETIVGAKNRQCYPIVNYGWAKILSYKAWLTFQPNIPFEKVTRGKLLKWFQHWKERLLITKPFLKSFFLFPYSFWPILFFMEETQSALSLYLKRWSSVTASLAIQTRWNRT